MDAEARKAAIPDELTLGTGLVAIERALIEKGRHVVSFQFSDGATSPSRRGDARFALTFDPPWHGTEEAFGSTWRGYTRIIAGRTPQALLAQIAEMDAAGGA